MRSEGKFTEQLSSPLDYLETSNSPGIMSDDGIPLTLQMYSAKAGTSKEQSCCISPLVLHCSDGFSESVDFDNKRESTLSANFKNADGNYCVPKSAPKPSKERETDISVRKSQKRLMRERSVRTCDIRWVVDNRPSLIYLIGNGRKENRKTEKPAKCEKCGRGFAWQRDLDRHVDVHKRSRATHLQLHVDKVPCEIASCTKTFARKDHMQRHLRNKHGY